VRHARVLLPGRADPVCIQPTPDGGHARLGGAEVAIPDDGWLPPTTGLVYGVILNDRASLETYGARMHQPPHGKPPAAPVLYIKPYNTHAGHRSIVTLPAGAERVEIGATLGIVFGATCTRVTEAAALSAVAGYTVVIDLSVPKEILYRPPILEKCFDGSCPIGPWVMDRAFVADPGRLTIRSRINGALRHTRSTDDLIRPISKLIAEVSEFMSFYAGDILLVGYPLTVPTAGAGDAIAVEIDGIGRLECRLAADDGGSP
jgi:5-oxopent-3-ene-1,2,5-tricarboxylate decarboxylase / 2-hydroxyhepta-2,4-diene-1,7-dioate isomerase